MSITRIGVISDTHGVLRPEAAEALRDVDHILHAGDVGGEAILTALRRLAPVTAVAGNNDDGSGEEIRRLTLGDLRVLLTHVLPRPRKVAARVAESLRRAPADVVVFGHSHLPHDEIAGGVWYFNPASAGPRRFDYPVAVGLFEKRAREWRAVHLPLDERSRDALRKRMNQLSR